MSFSKEKREQIKQYILDKIDCNEKNIAQKTSKTFSISQNTVYRYLRELESEKIIQKDGNKEYSLTVTMHSTFLHRNENELLEEDLIYNKYVKEYINPFPENIQKIWEYSFMEMMNNVIDHSEASMACIGVQQSYLNTSIVIWDNGVGIFKKIKEYYHYDSLDDAVHELFKGKLTTDKTKHSGEGIFFTSRILDEFAAISDGKFFTHDKYCEILQNLDEIPEMKNWTSAPGTIILMKLSNFSHKNLVEVFDMFANQDGGFTKTHIPLKNIFETYPVSRSQAKRLCQRFEKFKEIELDFNEIEEIGQGFAHEIFVVFQNLHPEVQLIPVHANTKVERMINHVKHSI